MAVNPLSDLNPGSRDWTVHVYVSRLWQHRGATDDGPIKHTDIVFQDTQGTHMYGEIATGLVSQFMDRIREGRVYELKRFLVHKKKNFYRPVEGEFIIRFGRYTSVREITNVLMDYPLCTYALTPIDALPRPSDMLETFTDVVGIVTGVSAVGQYHSASRATPSRKRIVYLSDINGFEISVILWGERADAFDAEGVLRSTRTEPVVVLFVGTLVKPFEGRRSLSGSAPCRWYINEELPEVTSILSQLNGRIPAVRDIAVSGQTADEISAQVDLETKTVKELIELNIWNHPKTRFYCTVDIQRLTPGQRYWFSACTTCNKGTIPFGSAYKCPDSTCDGVGAAPRYRISYLATDGTDEVELLFFDKTGKELIGKSALTLLRSKAPQGASYEEAVQYGRTDQSTPRELASIVATKYRFVVSVTTKSFEPDMDRPAYQVHRIDTRYGKQPRSSAISSGSVLAVGSSSKTAAAASGLAFVSPGGLNSIGLALAEQAIVDANASSPSAVSGLSGSLQITDVDASSVGVGSGITESPPSVQKPVVPSAGRVLVDSAVQKALLQDKATVVETDSVLETASENDNEELLQEVVDGSNAPPGMPSEPLTDKISGRRPRQQSAKGGTDSQTKKRKT